MLIKKDTVWLEYFFKENKHRLLNAYSSLTHELEIRTIPFIEASSAFFVFVDLSKYLPRPGHQGEIDLWTALIDAGVLISPGVFYELNYFFILYRVIASLFLRLPFIVCKMAGLE